jgi:tetratricopeptide (TPR) repeat protein
MRLMGKFACFLVVASSLFASEADLKQALALYRHTDYKASLQLLSRDPTPDAASYNLTGKNYFMLDDYKKAAEYLEKAVVLAPSNSEYMLWLGRSYGRRAETSNWFTAGPQASKARQCFEKAVALDPHNNEALNDLFDYYLNAPGFMGGGVDKAEAIAKRIEKERPAESNFEQAQIADKRKQYDAAEQHLRRAMELAPAEPGRMIDLARYLAKHGDIQESDELFARAGSMAPHKPGVLFARAKVDVEERRNLDEARMLLRQYLESELTPDDPPKRAAEKLLNQLSHLASGG